MRFHFGRVPDEMIARRIGHAFDAITCGQVLQDERRHLKKFTSLREKVQFWPYEPEADRMMPLRESEAKAIPRPGSAVLHAVGSHQYKIPEPERRRIHDVFSNFDVDGSNAIDVHELENVFRNLDVDPDVDQLELLMREYDEDNSGEMQFEEVKFTLPCSNGVPSSSYAFLESVSRNLDHKDARGSVLRNPNHRHACESVLRNRTMDTLVRVCFGI